jgi:hypothetical protein
MTLVGGPGIVAGTTGALNAEAGDSPSALTAKTLNE